MECVLAREAQRGAGAPTRARLEVCVVTNERKELLRRMEAASCGVSIRVLRRLAGFAEALQAANASGICDFCSIGAMNGGPLERFAFGRDYREECSCTEVTEQ